jgi:hypothetical protein
MAVKLVGSRILEALFFIGAQLLIGKDSSETKRNVLTAAAGRIEGFVGGGADEKANKVVLAVHVSARHVVRFTSNAVCANHAGLVKVSLRLLRVAWMFDTIFCLIVARW